MSKRESLWTRFKSIWRDPAAAQPTAAPDSQAEFRLEHNGIIIGTLTLTGGKWRFVYSDEFKHHPGVRTITEFPDVDQVYESTELWPFFLMRIPSLRRAAIREIIEKEHIDEHDEAELLKRFGRRTVANPFELVAH